MPDFEFKQRCAKNSDNWRLIENERQAYSKLRASYDQLRELELQKKRLLEQLKACRTSYRELTEAHYELHEWYLVYHREAVQRFGEHPRDDPW